jgi:endonuclease YncB( thermonuclease family)
MASPYQLALRGRLVIVGKEPDGDSVRFVADTPALYRQLARAYRITPSTADGSVQLRFEGVDAPELHYGSAAQPLGAVARDRLLERLGFSNVVYRASPPTMVASAEPPEGVGAAILSAMAEANGRPVSYVLTGDDASLPADGAWTLVDEALLGRTANAWLLGEGLAYYTVYTSTPVAHRDALRALAADARRRRAGVWELDRSGDFALVDQHSIGPDGQLVLPKLFRRCSDYLKAVAKGLSGNLADWIVSVSTGSRDENDGVLVCDRVQVHLADLLEQRNNRVAFQADPLDITFIEK